MKKYKYIVSLGSFCSPAMEFERFNRRQFSLPFDWLITPQLSTVVKLINNGFEDFLNEEYMFQFKEYPQYYKNKKSGIDFYHDFSPFKTFDSQIDNVTKKYNRRIERFYEVIKQPTLFLRYISEGEKECISENYESTLKTLQKFNPENNIIFVANIDIRESLNPELPIYYVEKDLGDGVSRKFLSANDELLQYILENVEEATTKKAKKKNKYTRIMKKVLIRICAKLNLVYRHSKLC